ncbi:hypothetical protein N2603_39720 [Bradyrhizobium huanghuaihaiense]|uniref:hypothetical protein n=1 Tax=Bradyrhizobium huanghuaihaiense TaxID=990078 RepID=UPI0021AA4A0D|nr:hypothetical protein [Bradyrhizobium sp. CB3035]UWU75991.1 hypothetical protein N2603_39720 [Bradyrhizobium sp. CB3035]
MRFKRSEGLTASENLLAELCDRSFLKLWTYPNLFKKSPGKELIDLLVVFGSDVIIFSDKSCSYPDTGDADLDWSRWYRRSIADSAHQIAQAERWIRSCPDRVFLDAKCTEKLPIELPNANDMRVHRICVALGALDRAEVETGTRALKIEPAVLNDAIRFTVGRTDKASGWVHVFDDTSLTTILSELSTIKDFIHYLDSKVALMETGNFKFAEAETDLLARYLWHNRTFPAEEGPYRIVPNLWEQVESSPEFLAGREANEVSYFWDGLIEYISDHYLNETLEFGNELSMSDHERTVRIMAGETRFFRRILSKAILERAEIAKKHAISTLLPSDQSDVSYVLYIGRGDQGKDHAAYRAERAKDLQLRCVAAKAVNPEKRFIVGIAMDARGVKGSSEDFFFMDTVDWTAEDIEKAQKMRTELGYFKAGSAIMSRLSEDEYPGSQKAVDVRRLAHELSGLTVSESLELAAMLKAAWVLPDTGN